MKTLKKITISKEKLLKIEKGAHRIALIETGTYSIPSHKVHKNKKAYNRKQKHKGKE